MLSSIRLHNAVIRSLSSQASNVSACPHISTGQNAATHRLQTKPLKDLPVVPKWGIIRGFMPGGEYYKKDAVDFFKALRVKYGYIFTFPGMFGNKPMIFTLDPKDFAMVFRTEGPWPFRDGLDSLVYHRRVHRAELFDGIGVGLANE